MSNTAAGFGVVVLLGALLSCSAQDRGHSLQDGWRWSQDGRVESSKSTTFLVALYDRRGPHPLDDPPLRYISVELPDHQVSELPFEFAPESVGCSSSKVWSRQTEGRHCGGVVRVLEARHEGLLVHYQLICANETVAGEAVFRVEGENSRNIWPFRDRPTMGERLAAEWDYAVEGAI